MQSLAFHVPIKQYRSEKIADAHIYCFPSQQRHSFENPGVLPSNSAFQFGASPSSGMGYVVLLGNLSFCIV
jgi:hypothetical protein